MALVTAGWGLTVVLVDTGGNKSTLRYDLTAADYTTAAVDRGTILAALAAVTDAVIVQHSLSEIYREDTTLYGGGEVENVALIDVTIDAAFLKTAQLRIPAPDASLWVDVSGPNWNVIDPTVAALQTYLNLWTTGNELYLSDGETILDPTVAGRVKGKRIHRGSRKG